jgi:hypothetical protein
LLERPLLSRHSEHACSVANGGFGNLTSDPSAPADHDNVLA